MKNLKFEASFRIPPTLNACNLTHVQDTSLGGIFEQPRRMGLSNGVSIDPLWSFPLGVKMGGFIFEKKKFSKISEIKKNIGPNAPGSLSQPHIGSPSAKYEPILGFSCADFLLF